jgi:tetratricopeptide (TPR) repeat protein
MRIKHILIATAVAAIALAGCKSVNDLIQTNKNPYGKRLFYEKYLNPADAFDARVLQTLDAVRNDPKSAALHNELGQLLRMKGFPKDSEVEFERAVDADPTFYPAWYNLGLIRQSRGNYAGARFALRRTVHYKPGHANALFQLGLIEEERHNSDAAIDYYAKALTIDRALLDVHVNPRVLDTKLIHLALLRAYPTDHARESMRFQQSPDIMFVAPDASAPAAPSPQAKAKDIVAPAPPVTNPATQTPPPTPKPPQG